MNVTSGQQLGPDPDPLEPKRVENRWGCLSADEPVHVLHGGTATGRVAPDLPTAIVPLDPAR